MDYGNIEGLIDSTQQVIYDYTVPTTDWDSYTKLLIHFDGADAGTAYVAESGQTLTFVGTAQLDTAQSKFGGSSLFLDGNSDYVTVPDSDDWSFGTGDFTIDFWIKFNALDKTQIFIGQYVDANNTWYCQISSGNLLAIIFITGGTQKGYYYTTSAPGFVVNTWYHVAFTRNGGNCYMHVDGISLPLSVNVAFDTNDVGNVASPLYIGTYNTTNFFTDGWIDEVRISKGIARWTSNFTPKSARYYRGITSLTISNLDGNTDEEYELYFYFVNGYSSPSYILRFNNDSGSNYGRQYMYSGSTTLTAGRDVVTQIDLGNSNGFGKSHFFVKSGYVRTGIVKFIRNVIDTTVTYTFSEAFSWNNTADNITSIDISTGETDGIGSGSRIVLLKKVVETGSLIGDMNVKGKVTGMWQQIYSNTLTSAATSVTISGLDGNTDTFYRLFVRHITSGGVTAGSLLYINNDTASNYGYQRMFGEDTFPQASRDTSEAGIILGVAGTNKQSFTELFMYAKSGYTRMIFLQNMNQVGGTTINDIKMVGYSWNNTTDNITSLVISADAASGLCIGTEILLERLIPN